MDPNLVLCNIRVGSVESRRDHLSVLVCSFGYGPEIAFVYISRRVPLLFSSYFRSVEGLLWGAGPRFEIGPALQQADALLSEPCRILNCWRLIDKYLLIRIVWCVGEEKVTCDAGPLLTCWPSHSNDRTVRDQHEVPNQTTIIIPGSNLPSQSENQCCGSMTFWCGSGSGSSYFRQWPSRGQQKTNFVEKAFLLITCWWYIYIIFQR